MIFMKESKQSSQPEGNPVKSNGFFFKDHTIQAKLSINQPNDVYEQQADHMADQVMRMPDPSVKQSPFFKPAISAVQRKCHECEEDDKKAAP